MDRRSKFLMLFLASTILSSIAITWYRYVYQEEFEVFYNFDDGHIEEPEPEE